MEPFFLVCLDCRNARPWHHRSDDLDCPNGCDSRYSMPWFSGFGPDGAPVPRHTSCMYGQRYGWPESGKPDLRVDNMAEMRAMCE